MLHVYPPSYDKNFLSRKTTSLNYIVFFSNCILKILLVTYIKNYTLKHYTFNGTVLFLAYIHNTVIFFCKLSCSLIFRMALPVTENSFSSILAKRLVASMSEAISPHIPHQIPASCAAWMVD